ncbi:MAG: TIM barrel protein [Flammeovirgaceae bacterium]|nr:TIM barrel protein [Flammeovirgaceae bacterium]
MKTNRRNALKKMTAGTAAVALSGGLTHRISAAENVMENGLKGKVNHSVCKWCYKDISLEDLCKESEKIGLQSIELLGVKDWPMLQKYGLTCAMGNGASLGITKGWNDLSLHDELVDRYTEIIPLAAKAGIKNVITFSGNRNGMDDDTGMINCAKGIRRIMSLAEQHNVTIVMELLNSKINHKDYMCDHTKWGAALCEMVGSEKMKLLYDIYHMQIMEGDVIRTIQENQQYIAHYHTGGVPGRNEIDDSQELYYPAIMKAILETGFDGFVAQEFIPAREDKLASLKQGVDICDI